MPRCKNCKEKFVATKFLQKHCGVHVDCKVAEGLYNLDQIKKKEEKAWQERKAAIKPITHAKNYKFRLQREINLLARNIDKYFGFDYCIDCDTQFGDDTPDGGHFNSVGSNATLRYNLHNIHSQRMGCNRDGQGGGKRLGYHRGLVKRYGEEYAEYVEIGLQKEFPYIGLKDVEYPEKIAMVRKLNRDFDTFVLNDPIEARNMFNKLIGIYD